MTRTPALLAALCLSAAWTAAGPVKTTYDLNRVEGMENFGGSARGREMLAEQGFAVAAPEFNQIYQAYVKSPVPVLITVDSAWHVYHLLMEQGQRELEQAQVGRLAQFSSLLLAAARSSGLNEIADYAAVGLALQTKTVLQPDQRRLIEAILAGSVPVQTPIGFPLSPAVFRAQEYYTESKELTAFYVAWQWYATVDFRLSDDRETKLALQLSQLIEATPELFSLWKKLNEPYDALWGQPVDGTVTGYLRAAHYVLGQTLDLTEIDTHSLAIRKKLQAFPRQPRITDQVLSGIDYAPFSKLAAGFRLLPARQLPDAVCLCGSVDPVIPRRRCPSGLDFMVGSPEMRSPAGLRAEEAQFGKYVNKAVQKTDPEPMPDSLYGHSMELLADLQKSLPSGLPAPFRTEAWADLQLWTQLGCWAEQRHTWLHVTIAATISASSATSGIVEPCPDFFAGLAKLARQTADVLDLDVNSALRPRLTEFATLCDHLAELARKDGKALTPDETKWIGNYGSALSNFSSSRDDFPCLSRIYELPYEPYIFYAGVGHPQALYMILPLNGRLQLYRGAVLSYREFVGYKKVTLDDGGWQRIVRAGKTPAAPLFTKSFRDPD